MPQPWEIAKKVQLSLIGNRQCAFHRAIDEPCALLLSPPKGWLKTRIFTFCVAFHIFVASNRRHFAFGMPTDHSKSQPMDDKSSLKLAWSRHVINFKFQGPKHTSGITEARIVKFLTQVDYLMLPKGRHITPKWAWLSLRDCFTILPFAVMQRVARVRQQKLSYLWRYSEILVENRRSEPIPLLFSAPVGGDLEWIPPKSLVSEN